MAMESCLQRLTLLLTHGRAVSRLKKWPQFNRGAITVTKIARGLTGGGDRSAFRNARPWRPFTKVSYVDLLTA